MEQINEYKLPTELVQACVNMLNRLEAGLPIPGTPMNVRTLLNQLEHHIIVQDSEFQRQKAEQMQKDREDLENMRKRFAAVES